MSLIGRAWSGLKSFLAAVTVAGALFKSLGGSANTARISAMRPYLAGMQPGLWASRHDEEVQHIAGWNYYAITAYCAFGNSSVKGLKGFSGAARFGFLDSAAARS
jgi:hypothetical protein